MTENQPQDVALSPYSRDWVERARSVLGDAACRQLGIYELPPGFRLSVVVPVYNEERNLRTILARVTAVPIPKELILVDDCSRDASRTVMAELAREMQSDLNQFRLAHHEKNQGKGAALRTGFQHASGNIVIIQDADQEYDPDEYSKLIQPILENKADVVFGSRFLGDGPHRVLYYWHYVGNKVLTTLSNCFTNLNLTDMETCYKLFRADILKNLDLREKRFGFEPEVTARISRIKGVRIYEVGISYYGRSYEEGKKIGWRDGFRAIYCILKYNTWSK